MVLDGNNNDCANLVGDPRLDPNRSRADVTKAWFSVAAFQSPATSQDGTSGRNILDAPGRKTVDLAIFRDFHIREQWKLQYRLEMTNGFNIVNLSSPASSLNSSAVGTIRTARDMRNVQMGLQLSF